MNFPAFIASNRSPCLGTVKKVGLQTWILWWNFQMDHTVKYNSVELAQSFSTQVQPSASVFKLEDFWNTLHFLSNWPTLTLQRGRLSGESGISLRRARLCEEIGSSHWQVRDRAAPNPWNLWCSWFSSLSVQVLHYSSSPCGVCPWISQCCWWDHYDLMGLTRDTVFPWRTLVLFCFVLRRGRCQESLEWFE